MIAMDGAPAPVSAPDSPADSCSEALRKKLAKIGLHSEADLLVHLPLRYEDETRMTPVARAPWGEPVQVEVVVQSCEIQSTRAGRWWCGRQDESGELTLRFFSFYPSQQGGFSEGARIRAFR
jgi:ATP-dependent DNA helicase RecG